MAISRIRKQCENCGREFEIRKLRCWNTRESNALDGWYWAQFKECPECDPETATKVLKIEPETEIEYM